MDTPVELPWPPTINHYYGRNLKRVYITAKGRGYRASVCACLRELGLRRLDGDLAITVYAYPPDKRPRDLDNLFKCLIDALERGGAFYNDSQIKTIIAHMCEPCRPRGKVVVTLTKTKTARNGQKDRPK